MGDAFKDIKIGEFLVDNEIITRHQLADALVMQKDNPGRVVGEILVTQGVLSKEQLIMAMEMYMMMNEVSVSHIDEWLDQEEVDLLMEKVSRPQIGDKK